MQERRQLPRQSVRLGGRIYFNDDRPSVPCLIQDISYAGARVIIFDLIDIPSEIKLYIPERNKIMHANVRWRHDNKIGLAFCDGEPDITGKWHRAPMRC